jgi:non-specific serine/threonine protein kinase
MIGKTISHYKILEKLGEGGMGKVYKAEDTKLKRIVAIKFLPYHLIAGKSIKERFFHEAQAASALNHPNIITIYDIHEEEDEVFLVMECVDGELLSEKLKDGSLKQKELIDIASGIANGLNAAHNADITHRDIKSENIIISKDGQVKIIDFGLAKQKGMSQITQDGTTLGTQAYMSPEQVQGVEADRRSDIFSFGVILYQMATSKLPFEGEHEAAVLYSIVNEAPIPVTTHNPNMDEELQRIINKALEKNVKDRYQHADDLLADLRKLKKGTTPKPTKAKTPVLRNLIYILGAISIVLSFYLTFIKKDTLPSEPAPVTNSKSIAILPFKAIGDSKEDEYFRDGIHDDILSQVAKIHDLKVVSRTSVLRYKDTDKNMKEIAQELSVETILEGSVRRAGEKVRIVAQLINAKTDDHLWTETYDRDYVDIFAIQTDVAEKIASALKATLTQEEISSIEKAPTENMEAYDYYLKGKYYWDVKTDREGNMMAAEMLEKAVELDPSFTLAYAWLAVVDFILYDNIYWDPTPERLEKGKSALEKATQLDPDLPEVHYAQAKYYVDIAKDHGKAVINYLKALEGRPNDSEINREIGESYRRLGEWDKAKQYLLKSYELDPHGMHVALYVASYYSYMRDWRKAEYYVDKAIVSLPEEGYLYRLKAIIALMGYGDTEKASRSIDEGVQFAGGQNMLASRFAIEFRLGRFQELLNAVEQFPDSEYYFLFKGLTHWLLEEEDQAKIYLDSARVVHKRLVQIAPDYISNYSFLGLVYAGLGRKEEAIKYGLKAVELQPVNKNAVAGPGNHLMLANVYSVVGEHDKALDEIELLLSIPYWFTTWDLKLNILWAPLRDHPRFQELIEKYQEKG